MAQSVLIVGASLAGIRCATSLRRAGFDGTVTVAGAEPHRPYDRPPLSKQFLAGDWEADRLALVKPDAWDDLDLVFLPSATALSLDIESKTVTFEHDSVSADAVVIATGARPRSLPRANDLAGVHVLRSLDDAAALRAELAEPSKQVVVIGAGFIGAEVAATAHEQVIG